MVDWIIYAVAGMVLYSIANIVWKYLSNSYTISMIGITEGLAVPVLVALAVFVVLMFATKQVSSINPVFVVLLFLVAALSIAGFGLFFYSLKFGKVAVVTAVMSLSTAVVAVLSFIFLGDRFSWRELLAMTLAIASVLVLALF
ncbi:MAG: DMT family transporter [Candidatus Marsarchaeota archaeon]|nr:DMT family transporter [Candidatus Marsarchaeota archaeon]